MGDPVRKQPEDHKEKQPKPVVVRGDSGFTVTHKGIEVQVGFDAFDDFELLRALAAIQSETTPAATRVTLIPTVFTKFFGDAEAQKVLDGLRDPATKRVRIEPAMQFLFDVFGAINPESQP